MEQNLGCEKAETLLKIYKHLQDQDTVGKLAYDKNEEALIF